MRGRIRQLMAAAILLSSAACSMAPKGRPSSDPDLIERYQIVGGQYSSAHDVVRALHPNWLIKRSPNGRSTADS